MRDLPGPERAQLVPPPPADPTARKPPTAPETRERRGFPQWIFAAWSGWLTVSIIVNVV
ncbi:hypothetical protein HC028_09745 [Planosporangium flavigriseum]|nr:hypothetical protein [Planosporangium flavigriseum]NJC64782.1 hypothetical protein [Planosporangium flavigriseum]